MSEIKLKIEYSVGSEIRRVKNTLAKLDWYQSHGYKPMLPARIKEDMNTSIIDEYDENIFNKSESQIRNQWQSFSFDFPMKLAKLGLEHREIYYIQLTNYGVKGSYNLPNKIILNVKNRDTSDISRTIIHEIIHLSIENWIVKYNVSHWQKERLVDLIFDKLYPGLFTTRVFKNDTSCVDDAFDKNYPDIEKVIQNLKLHENN